MISEREISVLEWKELLEKIISKAATGPGKERISNLSPLSKNEAEIQLKRISEFKLSIFENFPIDFSGIYNITDLITRAAKGAALSMDDIFSTRQTVIAYERIRKYLLEYKEELPSTSQFLENFIILEKVANSLKKSITDKGELNSSAYPIIGKLQKEIQSIKFDIENKLRKLISSSSMNDILQEKIHTIRNDKYVILIKANMKGKIKGTVLDISASGATLFLEPDSIASLNSSMLLKMFELEREIQKILANISNEIGSHSEDLVINQQLIAELDLLNASAKFSIDINGNSFEISDNPELEIYHARHPLLHLMVPGEVVANNIILGKDYNSLVITGANTGGKTVLLKTVGLCALMAAHGLHIPASADSKLGIFTKIIADIGDDQSLQQSLSTYSGQIVMINEMLKQSDNKTLLLIDEIISGTNPRHGAALAQSILEELANKEAKIIVTTHYPELKDLASVDNRFMNASVSFDLDTLKPTYRLKAGIPGVSYTLEIAKIYNIPESIISRSKEFLSDSELSTEALIEKIQRYEKEILDEQEKIKDLRYDLDKEKNKYHKLKQRLEKEIQQAKEGKGIEFLEELSNYRKDISSKIKNLQNLNIQEAGELQENIINIQDTINVKIKKVKEEKFTVKYENFDVSKVSKGDTIFIKSLEKNATIDEINISKKTISVILGNSIRSRFKFDDILIISNMQVSKPKKEKIIKKQNIKSSPKINKEKTIPPTFQTQFNTIDLRGMRVDEAMNKMENELDRMLRGGINQAIIIHGHGTGAIKEAVRSNLNFSFYANNFRPGEQNEGGDGVTVVLLNR